VIKGGQQFAHLEEHWTIDDLLAWHAAHEMYSQIDAHISAIADLDLEDHKPTK